MDWQLKPAAKNSEISGSPFSPGSMIVSILTRDEAGELLRRDFLESEWETMDTPSPLLGRWSRQIKEKNDPAAQKREQVKTAEALFLSLFETDEETGEAESPAGEMDEQVEADSDRVEVDPENGKPGGSRESTELQQDVEILKYLLSVILERKRILKANGRAGKSRQQKYRHVKSGRIIAVPVIELNADNAALLYQQMQHLLD